MTIAFALAESEQTLKLVVSELDQYTKNAELFKVYYATTRAYGEAACHSVAHTRRMR
jgi:hypothetical protein